MANDHATVAEEEYLQTIFWLQEAGLPMTGANVARAMQLSAPTVHEMIGRLEADGYVTRSADKSLKFTASGKDHAAGINATVAKVSTPRQQCKAGSPCTHHERPAAHPHSITSVARRMLVWP